jgi:hypothetical protein
LLLSFQKEKKVILFVFLLPLGYRSLIRLVLDCYLTLNLISLRVASLLLFLIRALFAGKLLFYPSKIRKCLSSSSNLSILNFLALCLLFLHTLMANYHFQYLFLLVRAFDLLITFCLLLGFHEDKPSLLIISRRRLPLLAIYPMNEDSEVNNYPRYRN